MGNQQAEILKAKLQLAIQCVEHVTFVCNSAAFLDYYYARLDCSAISFFFFEHLLKFLFLKSNTVFDPDANL